MLRVALIGWLGFAALAVAAEKPNIIVIMSDDMGFSDLGCYGSEINTPHLDSLAAGGIRFTQFYNTARCCPTRASLLTGLYPHQAGIGHMMDDRGSDGYRGELSKKTSTMAERLKPAGYNTYAIGKWHVTRLPNQQKINQDNWPLQRGFDRFYGTIHGAGSFYDPSSLVRDNTLISPYADPEYKPSTYYYTDAISDHVARFIKEHTEAKKNPFFMYVTYTCAHWPMHALPEDIAKYKGKYSQGYEPIRKARFEKAAKLGLIDPKQGTTPLVAKWDDIANKEWEATGMEVYAAMIDRMDQGIGRIIDTLKKNGQYDNTLILFLQDNGACAELQGRAGNKVHPNIDRPDSPTLPVIKANALIPFGSVPPQTRDGYPVRMGPKAFPGPADTYVAYGRNWATVSNTPFREYKHWVHEGGISSPLIAHWPQGIKAELRNSITKQAGHLIDIMATCADLGEAKPLADKLPIEGASLRPVFAGQNIDRKAPLFWEHEGNRAIRDGKWKLVAKFDQPWELYDIDTDRTELHNLADKEPERVKTMTAQWEAWAQRAGVKPWEEIQPMKKNKK